MKRHRPNRAKGRRYPTEISCVAWMDLLGYGSMLRPVGFNPTAAQALQAVARLEQFQATAAEVADRYQRALIINDGVAYVRQLSPRTASVGYDFLHRMFQVFQDVNAKEKAMGHCGARMIVAVGPRLRIRNATKQAKDHLSSILQRYEEGFLKPEQAIREAFRSLPYTGSVIELQANFAFTKAYLADAGGSKVGLAGACFYVDSTLFQDELPKWLTIEKVIDWKTDGLAAKFLEITAIDHAAAGVAMQSGIRNALEIAAALNINYGA